jgi:hypothetical protein
VTQAQAASMSPLGEATRRLGLRLEAGTAARGVNEYAQQLTERLNADDYTRYRDRQIAANQQTKKNTDATQEDAVSKEYKDLMGKGANMIKQATLRNLWTGINKQAYEKVPEDAYNPLAEPRIQKEKADREARFRAEDAQRASARAPKGAAAAVAAGPLLGQFAAKNIGLLKVNKTPADTAKAPPPAAAPLVPSKTPVTPTAPAAPKK